MYWETFTLFPSFPLVSSCRAKPFTPFCHQCFRRLPIVWPLTPIRDFTLVPQRHAMFQSFCPFAGLDSSANLMYTGLVAMKRVKICPMATIERLPSSVQIIVHVVGTTVVACNDVMHVLSFYIKTILYQKPSKLLCCCKPMFVPGQCRLGSQCFELF